MRTILEWLKPGARVKRYILLQIVSVAVLIFCIVTLKNVYDLNQKMLLAYIVLITLSVFGMIFSFIINAINSIGFFWLGNTKGSIFFIISIFSVAMTYVFVYFNFDIESILALGIGNLIAIGVVIALLLNVLSCFVCIKIYTKKHS